METQNGKAKYYHGPDRNAFIRTVFGDERLSRRQEQAVLRVFDYLERNGRAYAVPGGRDASLGPALMDAMEKTLSREYGKSVAGVMEDSRTPEDVMLRTFCYMAYRKYFPVDPVKKISDAFGNARSRSAIQIAMHGFPDRLLYEPEVREQYQRFMTTLTQILEKNADA